MLRSLDRRSIIFKFTLDGGNGGTYILYTRQGVTLYVNKKADVIAVIGPLTAEETQEGTEYAEECTSD